ncbi:unnamed protein product [Triticum turgidum subsp. durum]|uniref:Beta-fructofuranosidase n=1 Tax=Triticum turgidum subsp. durum TaxID=4567 RepID=A0A9R0Q962_TRITD|nr:unnamed protein product [Triticum turgidum subsp. durum]
MPCEEASMARIRCLGILLLTLACSTLGVAAADSESGEKLRTSFHFQPARNWINDPNGPMYYRGFYHLFVQYNPTGPHWRNIVWGHAVSSDLLSWVFLEPAIAPSAPYDAKGTWSGSATVLPDGRINLMYTGVQVHGRQVQNLAVPRNYSDPFLREWVKSQLNPVIVPGAGVNSTEFRDPSTAWRGADGLWRVLLATKDHRRHLVLLYRSTDFTHWSAARRPFHEGHTGMVECADFFPLSSAGSVKHVLKISVLESRRDVYFLGAYDDSTDKFLPDDGNDDGLQLDFGIFYASKSFFDPSRRRRVVWAWAKEQDATADDEQKGWAGVLAIPREVWLAHDGRQLMTWLVAEVDSLRTNRVHIADMTIQSGDYFEIAGLQLPAQADLDVEFQVSNLERAEPFQWRAAEAADLCAARGADVQGGVGPFGVWVLASRDLRERTAVSISVFKADERKHMILFCNDVSNSSYSDQVDKHNYGGLVQLDLAKAGGRISLRTLVDNCIVEAFGSHGKIAILSRVYPTSAVGNKARAFVFNKGKSTIVVSRLDAYDMASVKIS